MRKITLENGQTINISEESYQNLQKGVQNKRWKPRKGEDYYFVEYLLIWGPNPWHGNVFDERQYKCRNVFETKDQAERKVVRLEKKYEILDRIEELNEGWWPDWKSYQTKFLVSWDAHNNDPFVEKTIISKNMPDEFYLKNDELADQLIKKYGDDLVCLFEL
jgi:hypothetical protein